MQTVYTRYLEPGEKGEEAAEGCSQRGASARRTGGIYNKKKNINGKREANEKERKRRVEASEALGGTSENANDPLGTPPTAT